MVHAKYRRTRRPDTDSEWPSYDIFMVELSSRVCAQACLLELHPGIE